jgi:hypothetical protein
MSVHRPAGSGPVGTGEQVPALPAMLQALQAVQEALEQQTPSVHMPLRQTALLVQVDPSGLRLVQIPLWQVVPATQSVFEAYRGRRPGSARTSRPRCRR